MVEMNYQRFFNILSCRAEKLGGSTRGLFHICTRVALIILINAPCPDGGSNGQKKHHVYLSFGGFMV